MFKDIHLALVFLTRLSWPALKEVRPLATVVWAFPLVGCLVGGLAGALFFALSYLGINGAVAILLILGLEIRLTGALHEDGLADIADGLGGGTNKESKLAIMKDSRIGSFGAIALLISLLLRFFILSGIENVLWALIYAHALSRALMPPMMYYLKPARDNGLAYGAGRPELWQIALGLMLGIGIGFWVFPLYQAGLSLLLGIVSLLYLIHLFRQHLGGQTGDSLGAVQQITYIAILLGLSTYA